MAREPVLEMRADLGDDLLAHLAGYLRETLPQLAEKLLGFPG